MHSLQSRAGLTATLLAGLVLAAVPSATAAITFDAASRAATTSTGRTSLSWPHVVGGGADRVLVVGVAVEDASTADANITSVTFNGVPLVPVPNSKRSGGGTGIIQTQLFYLLNGSLGAAGSRTITVTMQGAVDGISAGAVSLAGASQAAPQAAATGVDTSGADSISTSITSPAGQLVGRGRGGQRQLRLLHRGRRPDRTRGHRGERHDGRHEHEGADRGRRHHPRLGPQRRQPPRALAGVAGALGRDDAEHLHADHERQRLGIGVAQPQRGQLQRGDRGHAHGQPRRRFPVLNNHYLNIPDYGIASRQNAQVRVENNYFDNVDQPIRADTSLSDVAGQVNQVSTNIFVNSGPNSITTPVSNFVPPYTYRWMRRAAYPPSCSRERAWERWSSDRPTLTGGPAEPRCGSAGPRESPKLCSWLPPSGGRMR